MNTDFLSELIGARSVAGDAPGNRRALDLLTSRLSDQGFDWWIEGQEITEQPCLIARRAGRGSNKRIVLYGHYDVAPVRDASTWISADPFAPESIAHRIYARGIADNKGPLAARLDAIDSLDAAGRPTPEILWLIQGEEEIGRSYRVATDVFARHLAGFDCHVFVEETGFHRRQDGQPITFLWSSGLSRATLVTLTPHLSAWLPGSCIEFRHLNKLNGAKTCPLLGNLPPRGVYLGFGPNDYLHRIHRDNESLQAGLLREHVWRFSAFLTAFANSDFELKVRQSNMEQA